VTEWHRLHTGLVQLHSGLRAAWAGGLVAVVVFALEVLGWPLARYEGPLLRAMALGFGITALLVARLVTLPAEGRVLAAPQGEGIREPAFAAAACGAATVVLALAACVCTVVPQQTDPAGVWTSGSVFSLGRVPDSPRFPANLQPLFLGGIGVAAVAEAVCLALLFSHVGRACARPQLTQRARGHAMFVATFAPALAALYFLGPRLLALCKAPEDVTVRWWAFMLPVAAGCLLALLGTLLRLSRQVRDALAERLGDAAPH
jgi:hypothetical protein